MNQGGLILIIGALVGAAAAFSWLAIKIESSPRRAKRSMPDNVTDAAKTDVEHIFNAEFREELRNRGRLHFEKIIGQNATLLHQDLQRTTDDMSDYMRREITRTLQEEFKKYEQSIADAKKIALESMDKTVSVIEQQRHLMEDQLKAQSDAQKERVIKRFETEMASIVNHYVLKAIGNQIDLTDQLDFIMNELETNKQAIIEDIKNGAA
jgi:F0F1-type ATP synthase membrane subunit b/b'